MLYKAHAIAQKRKGPHVLVWNEEAKQNWPKTKNKGTIRSPKEGEALKCSCEVWKLGKSDTRPYTIVCKREAQEPCDRRGTKQEQSDYLDSDNKPYDRTKHRASHHFGNIEPRRRRKRSHWLPKDTIRSPNLKETLMFSCEVLKAMEWVRKPYTIACLEVCLCMVQ